MILLLFVVLAFVGLVALGRFVTPYAERKPLRSWSLDDYGRSIGRALKIFTTAGNNNAFRMDRMHKEAGRKPGVHPEGLRIVEGPLDESEHDPRRRDPDSPFYDPDAEPQGPWGPDASPRR